MEDTRREVDEDVCSRHEKERDRDMNHLLEVLDNMPEQNNLDDDAAADNVDDANDSAHDTDDDSNVNDHATDDNIDDSNENVDDEAGGRERGVNHDRHVNGDIMKGTSFDLY